MAQPSDLLRFIRLLKQVYSDSHLITEFLIYEEGEYAIRAMVKRGETILATGMAAAATIEVAEDQAKMRAIASLDIHVPDTVIDTPVDTAIGFPINDPVSKTLAPLSLTSESSTPEEQDGNDNDNKPVLMPVPQTPVYQNSNAAESDRPSFQDIPSSPPSLDDALSSRDRHGNVHLVPLPKQAPSPVSSISTVDVTNTTTNTAANTVATTNTAISASSSSSAATSSAATSSVATASVPANEPPPNANLLDSIAKTSVEMRRLGWDVARGRQCLQERYGKRSRQELTDEEVLDFLNYLESQFS